jgi:hypothetical protein
MMVVDRNTTGSVGGDCRWLNNICVSNYHCMGDERDSIPAGSYDCNTWYSPIATPFRWGNYATQVAWPYAVDQDTSGTFGNPNLDGENPTDRTADLYKCVDPVPSWYTPGMFGPYEPAKELDINGEYVGAYLYRSRGCANLRFNGSHRSRYGARRLSR